MTKIVLPQKKIKASAQSPKNLIIFSKPKVGKTSLLADLESCLILDFEDGSDYVDALKLKVNTVEELKLIGAEIKEQGHPYKYIAVDTVTALEEKCIPVAEKLYSKSSMGKNWFKTGKQTYGNILNLPNGAGYVWLRQAITSVLEYIKTLAPRIIIVGHVKDIMLEKAGAEFTSSDLDLTGKIKRIISSQSDAIGYLYRKGNQNILNFKTSDAVACGARPDHLRNQQIVISEMTEEGVKTNWDKVYID
jgi:hypothetical protein